MCVGCFSSMCPMKIQFQIQSFFMFFVMKCSCGCKHSFLFCFMLINQTCPFAVHVKPVIFLKLSPGLNQFYSVFPQLSTCCHNVLNRTCCRKHLHIVTSPLEEVRQGTFIWIWWHFLYKLYLAYASYYNLWWSSLICIPAAGDLQRPYNISDELSEWECYIALAIKQAVASSCGKWQ